ncbi:MAG: Flp pilus assembly complex ATPase component, partial [Planctomycetes bacterium]|nr:Flp pilus assembly complex ATPase component [Planctomycetota bacterium]
GVQAALTGHLVMSSIHANDTIAALFRLLDLGVEKFLVSSSLVGIVAQRMIRRVCTHCKRPMIASDEERLIYEKELRERRREFYYGQGCASCANTGYKGRTGVHEILIMSEELRRMLLNGATPGEIKDVAVEEGMISMWRNGMLKVKQGITTPYELMRTVYSVES